MNRGFVALFLFLSFAAFGEAGQLSGVVRSAETGQPLAGAKVEVRELGLSVTTQGDGAFVIPVEERTFLTLLVTREGYYPATFNVSLPTPSLTVELIPVVPFTEQVEVRASRARSDRDPVTFTNLPRERIEESYFGQDPAMLLAATVPGFFAYNDNGHGIGYSYFAIRGFGQARTRVSLNGAPLNDAESGELFFIDLADFLATAGDIQVQRGVFGLSGMGGAVDITTAPASLEPSFQIHLGGGSYNTQRLTLRYESGLVGGQWALTARYSKITTDGYRDQSWVDMWNYFFSLSHFGQRSRTRLVLFGGPEQTHLAYYGIPKSVLKGGLSGNERQDRRFNPLTYPGEIDNFLQPHFQLISEASLGPRTQLSQTFYLFQGDGYYDQFRANRRLVEYNLPNITLPDGTVIRRTDLVRRRTVDEWDAGWVPTLTWTGDRLSLELAGEVRFHKARHYGQVIWARHYPPGIPPNRRYYDYQVEKRSSAVRVKASYRLSDHLLAVGGVGYAHHVYDFSKDRLKGLSFADNFDFLLPQLGLLWRVREGQEAYLNLARGMREPNFRQLYDPQDYYGTRAFLDPEDVWNWEAGYRFRGSRLAGRINVFYMRFTNEIVWAGALDDSGVPIYGNGARSIHKGLELESSWSPSPRLGLDASLTLSRNTFTRYREFGYDGSVISYDGNRIAGFPDLLFLLTARTQVAGVQTSLTLRAVDRFFLDNTQDNRKNPSLRRQPGYVPLVNPGFAVVDLTLRRPLPALAASLGLQQLGVEVRVNNLLDKLYTSFGYVDSGKPMFIPAAPRHYYVGLTVGL
ncbi:MAG: TonB-dependent receptor [Thermoanaerobaculum sp.]|nr:TonB-dependent receptor [Thermoanaerobaculum sp.]